jgi:hypothetical protein
MRCVAEVQQHRGVSLSRRSPMSEDLRGFERHPGHELVEIGIRFLRSDVVTASRSLCRFCARPVTPVPERGPGAGRTG